MTPHFQFLHTNSRNSERSDRYSNRLEVISVGDCTKEAQTGFEFTCGIKTWRRREEEAPFMNRHWNTKKSKHESVIKANLNELKACETHTALLVSNQSGVWFSLEFHPHWFKSALWPSATCINKAHLFRIRDWIIVPVSCIPVQCEDVATLREVYSITWMNATHVNNSNRS